MSTTKSPFPKGNVRFFDENGNITTPWLRWLKWVDEEISIITAYINAHP